ncbi:SxtJ family membrane protein [Galbibacter mesophilus]|uniref:SxtJ family membrane protein n=1 Tax=Galbibacter mesophilus TaxID=379069 RepID=UPI0037434DDD
MNKSFDKIQRIEVAILIGIGLIISFFYSKNQLFLYLSIGVLLLGIILPIIFQPITYLWFKLAELLSLLFSFIILAGLFYFLITPIAYIRRFLKKDNLMLLAFNKNYSSAFKSKNHKYSSEDLKHPF